MEKISEEEAGRRTRYEAFEKAAKEWGATKIAVAHNSNDRSETQLFHLFRGSGIRGLASILPVRDRIIRPLLCLERWEIEKFYNSGELSIARMPPMRRMTTQEIVFGIIFCLMRRRIL